MSILGYESLIYKDQVKCPQLLSANYAINTTLKPMPYNDQTPEAPHPDEVSLLGSASIKCRTSPDSVGT